jgi:membrane protease YdiL (CAAX protease family)
VLSARQIGEVGGLLVAGVLLFGVGMAAAVGLVLLNARSSPAWPWFPVPIILLLVALAVQLQRRVGIGLVPVSAGQRVRAAGFTTLALLIGMSACLLQGALFDMVRSAETGPAGTSARFRFAYTLTLSVTPAVLAELVFRGWLQTRLTVSIGAFSAIAVITAVNTAAHRWGPDLAAQWLGYLVALGLLGWLRWITGSLWPPLLAHGFANAALALSLWHWGPVAQGKLPGAALLAALLAAVVSGWLLARAAPRDRQQAEG